MKIYCPLLQTTVLFAVPLKAAAKPSALRGQYERRLLVAKPPPAMDCRYCKIVDFAIEPGIESQSAFRMQKSRHSFQKRCRLFHRFPRESVLWAFFSHSYNFRSMDSDLYTLPLPDRLHRSCHRSLQSNPIFLALRVDCSSIPPHAESVLF